jgi:hypothetical protein
VKRIRAFYTGDSTNIKNDILGYCKLTMEDLQRMNFTVVYPHYSNNIEPNINTTVPANPFELLRDSRITV